MTGQNQHAFAHLDPAVRAAVFDTVTEDEAYRILRSRAGKPWCNVFVAVFGDTLARSLDDYPKEAESLRSGVTEAAGGWRAP